jgi:hypothetical protein
LMMDDFLILFEKDRLMLDGHTFHSMSTL